jgi:hypothetical protein
LAERRRRKQRPVRVAVTEPSPPVEPNPASRSEQRAAVIRAELEPFAPGERPPAIVIAAIVAAALGIANLVAYAVGVKIDGKSPGPAVLLFPAVMALAATGMWRMRYWAVLGFEALLALIVIVFALFLVRAANVEAVLVSVTAVSISGWLFFKLVRVMARLQTPPREPPARDI